MALKNILSKTIQKIVNSVMGNDLSQDEYTAVGEKYETEGIRSLIERAASESIVLLKNDGVLPLKKQNKLCVFGRCQYDSFYVGYGSGGDVQPTYNVNIIDGLRNCTDLTIDTKLADYYANWCRDKKNIPDQGWWAHWPYNYEEMPLSSEIVKQAIDRNNDTALIIIGRAAGEDRENKLEEGSYYLTQNERDMLKLVTEQFDKVIVLMNCGNIIDMEWINDYNIKAVVYAWQLGEELGNAVANVISGKVNACGKLADTIAISYNDYPSSKDFGNKEFNNYAEDIFVGYRYFETFAKDRVLFPFGYGLSYTDFDVKMVAYNIPWENESFINKGEIAITCKVTNIGSCAGKEVVQIYASKPTDKLSQANKNLVAFAKTKLLEPNESEVMVITFPIERLACYDDSGITGYKSSYILIDGKYNFYICNNSACDKVAFTVNNKDIKVISTHTQICASPTKNLFNRLTNKGRAPIPANEVDLRTRILANLPKEIKPTGDKGIKLQDVAGGNASIEDFVAQLSDLELQALTRGEGSMNSDLGVSGNAGAFGGIIASLRDKGIPPIITCDGPAGIRIKRYTALLPCGTALACTWNADLMEELFTLFGKEMLYFGTDIILSPGMNIHRNPLCGRNFEYFSEDPLLTGKMAAAVTKGVQSNGVGTCPKHFACNNQETNRNRNDSRISERALREIYLKGFEICVKESNPMTIMTSYNKINGVWNHYNYDLVTTLLRDEWGYSGCVMTDWWMRKSRSPEFPNLRDHAYRVRGQIDVFMPGNMGHLNKQYSPDKTLLETIDKPNGITRGELQRSAINVLNVALKLKYKI